MQLLRSEGGGALGNAVRNAVVGWWMPRSGIFLTTAAGVAGGARGKDSFAGVRGEQCLSSSSRARITVRGLVGLLLIATGTCDFVTVNHQHSS